MMRPTVLRSKPSHIVQTEEMSCSRPPQYSDVELMNSSKHTKLCERHKEEIYSVGCEHCCQLFCFDCLNSPPDCPTGEGSLDMRYSFHSAADGNSSDFRKIRCDNEVTLSVLLWFFWRFDLTQ